MSSFATHFLQKVLLVREITFTMNRFTSTAKTIYFREMIFFGCSQPYTIILSECNFLLYADDSAIM